MRKKKSSERRGFNKNFDVKKLALFVAIALIMLSFSVLALFWNKCCTDPSCTECYKEEGYCLCDLKERLGMYTCDECASKGCGFSEHIEPVEGAACH